MNAATRLDRREFLTACVGACTLALVGGCASLATRPVTSVDGVVRLPLADHPELAHPRGTVRILPDGERTPLLVVAAGDRRFTVLSTVCTHRGCTVEARGDQLVCPCHGSTYDHAGAVLRGPAERPLRAYPARVVGDAIEIMLREAR